MADWNSGESILNRLEAFYDRGSYHIWGKKLSEPPPHRPYRAPVEGGTVPQLVGISVSIEGARPTHPRHQSYSYDGPRRIPHYTPGRNRSLTKFRVNFYRRTPRCTRTIVTDFMRRDDGAAFVQDRGHRHVGGKLVLSTEGIDPHSFH